MEVSPNHLLLQMESNGLHSPSFGSEKGKEGLLDLKLIKNNIIHKT